jgi:1-deoxy-D-xylulose-5-phosphate reductoisomerase
VYHSLKNGKHVLLANKESYVVAGEFLNNISKESNSTIFPIDSEHSAIHQCLQGIENKDSISRLILTGSGGPFLKRDLNDFASITPQEAVAHPVWTMGEKISVDSSTMMNKCLEIIEARWLFDIEDIDVIIHPEGIVHSMVEFGDNSVIAQLSVPDMKIPIAHGLGFPKKIPSGAEKLSLDKIKTLSFEEPDFQKFPALLLAKDCLNAGGTSFTILNAANEECVDAFLKGKITYLDIHKIISKVLDNSYITNVQEVEEFFEVDKQSRQETNSIIALN